MITTSIADRGRRVSLSLLIALAWCGAVGCGGPKYEPPPVGGSVVWQNGSEPRELEGGAVEFEAEGTVAAKAVLTADGTFRLDAALPPGTYRVRVTAPPGSRQPSVLDPRFESFATSDLVFKTTDPQPVTFRVRKRGQ